jgi:hypothetical protein
MVTATIANQPVHLVLDSGMPGTILTPAAANRLNLIGARAATADAPISAVTVQTVTFGSLTVHNDNIAISNIGIPPQVDGRVGEDVLSKVDIGLDYPDGKIYFYVPSGCAASQIPWSGSFAPVQFTRAPDLAPMIPYQIDNATLNFIIDTGVERSFVQQQALDRAKVTPKATRPGPVVILGRGTLPTQLEEFSSVSVGAEEFSDSWLLAGNSNLPLNFGGVLGNDYLMTHKVFIANSSNTAFFGLSSQ